jgi:His-Xaa-Ser system protein HxsD
MLREVVVEFDAATQSLAALTAAAYRLIGTATCQVETASGQYLCRLSWSDRNDNERDRIDHDTVRARFIDLVTDENLRERLAIRTEPLRNVIVSLAFCSLANQSKEEAS